MAPGSARCPAAAPRSSTPRCARSSATASSTPTSGSRSTAWRTGWGSRRNCTMLYGHVEKAEHKVDHLLRLRALQDETRRLQRLHPARLPPREQLPGAEAPHHRPRRPAPHRDRAPGARQHPAHQGLLGDGDAEARPGGAVASAPTTSTARWCEETIYHMAGAETAQMMPRRRARARRARRRLRAGRARHPLPADRTRGLKAEVRLSRAGDDGRRRSSRF